MPESDTLMVRVDASRWEAESVTSFDFVSPAGVELPVWEPGSHIDVHLPSGAVRQYSLCGDPADRGRYRIAVLELLDGRGGSVEAHRELRPGRLVEISHPRSNFALVEADRYVFVAGGIGITPILPMLREVDSRGIKWELVYGARSTRHFAFADELTSEAVRFVAQDTDGLIDIDDLVDNASGAVVYCCGPGPLMDVLVERMSRAGRGDDLHLERFGAAPTPTGTETASEIELARTGVVVCVPPDSSVLEAIRAAGVEYRSSCEIGICGTCETAVLAGEIDHRDSVLTDEERARADCMMICVSRAKGGGRLLLDI